MRVLRPPRLRPGATIGVAAVSGPVEEERLEAGLRSLRSKGYRVVESTNLRRRDGFLAGSDSERAAGYRELLRDPNVDAIFFARGGYGSGRILPFLDPGELRSYLKIHLGGSDLTALFAFAWRHASLVTYYGPMVAVEMPENDSLDWEAVLSGQPPAPHAFAPGDILSSGVANGPLLGGCLSLAAALCGTPEALRGEGAVFFWEDVGEEVYRLDRMLTQLERSGTFAGLQGMIVGSIAPGRREDAETPESVRAWLARRFERSGFPVAMGFPAGHLEGARTLPLGEPVRLDLERGVLEFRGPVVG